MNIKESYVTKNKCYSSNRTIKVKGLMLHSIGCAQSRAEVLVKNYNTPTPNGQSVCVHAFIDSNDGTVYKILPWDHRGWHCGSGKNGSFNNTHIGIEMCESEFIKYTSGSGFTIRDKNAAEKHANTAYSAAVELFAMLCKEYNLDPLEEDVIVSHSEGHSKGKASNHADPEHYWKGLGLSYTMDGFRNDVKKAMTSEVNPKPNQNEPAPIPSFEPFMVRVEIPDLNIRKGPGINYDRTGHFTGPGVFTIVEVSGSWGKLKSGAGWISLNYAKRI